MLIPWKTDAGEDWLGFRVWDLGLKGLGFRVSELMTARLFLLGLCRESDDTLCSDSVIGSVRCGLHSFCLGFALLVKSSS